MFCKKGVLTNFAKFTRKRLRSRLAFNEVEDLQSLTLSKKRFRHRCFLVNSAKFLITLSLKNPLDGCFCINTRSVYCPTTTFSFFKNDVTHIFRLSIFQFSLLNLQTWNKSKLNISNSYPDVYNPFENLRRSFFFENS